MKKHEKIRCGLRQKFIFKMMGNMQKSGFVQQYYRACILVRPASAAICNAWKYSASLILLPSSGWPAAL